MPPTRPRIGLYIPKICPTAVAVPPHPTIKTTEKPSTNNNAWKNVFHAQVETRLYGDWFGLGRVQDFILWVMLNFCTIF